MAQPLLRRPQKTTPAVETPQAKSKPAQTGVLRVGRPLSGNVLRPDLQAHRPYVTLTNQQIEQEIVNAEKIMGKQVVPLLFMIGIPAALVALGLVLGFIVGSAFLVGSIAAGLMGKIAGWVGFGVGGWLAIKGLHAGVDALDHIDAEKFMTKEGPVQSFLRKTGNFLFDTLPNKNPRYRMARIAKEQLEEEKQLRKVENKREANQEHIREENAKQVKAERLKTLLSVLDTAQEQEPAVVKEALQEINAGIRNQNWPPETAQRVLDILSKPKGP